MLTKLYNDDIFFHPYHHSFYNSPSGSSYEMDIWPFDDSRQQQALEEEDEDVSSYLEYLDRMRRQQQIVEEEEFRQRTRQRLLMEERKKKMELEKARMKRRTEEQKQISLLQNMLLEEKRQREIDRQRYEDAMARYRPTSIKKSTKKSRSSSPSQGLYRHHPSHTITAVKDEDHDNGSHVFYLGPKTTSNFHERSNKSSHNIRPKLVRINPTLHEIAAHVEQPMVCDPEDPETGLLEDSMDDTGSHVFFFGPQSTSNFDERSNKSRPNIRPKLVRINPNLQKIKSPVEPLMVLNPKVTETEVLKDSNSSQPNHGCTQIHISVPTVMNQSHKTKVMNNHSLHNQTRSEKSDMKLDSTLEPKLVKRKIVPIVNKKKKIIKYAGLIGDVEDASDSECEDEFSDYIRNRRPTKGHWIEPVESIQTIVF